MVAGEQPDTVLLLEHERVYTAGKRTEPQERPIDGTPVVDVDRGGKITWHGPGQITGYPIVRLPAPVDVVGYVRQLEEMMIRVCADFGVDADPRRGPQRGLGGRRRRRARTARSARSASGSAGRSTMHGFALNCNPDLSWGEVIIPCGIVGAGVTSLSFELGRDVTVAEVLPHVEKHLSRHPRRRCAPRTCRYRRAATGVCPRRGRLGSRAGAT